MAFKAATPRLSPQNWARGRGNTSLGRAALRQGGRQSRTGWLGQRQAGYKRLRLVRAANLAATLKTPSLRLAVRCRGVGFELNAEARGQKFDFDIAGGSFVLLQSSIGIVCFC